MNESFVQTLKHEAMFVEPKWKARYAYTRGAIARRKGEFREAQALWQESYDISVEINDQESLGKSQTGLAIIYQRRCEMDKVMDLVEKNYAIHKKRGDKIKTSDSLLHMGIVYNYRGEHAKAFEYYLEAYKLVVETGNQL